MNPHLRHYSKPGAVISFERKSAGNEWSQAGLEPWLADLKAAPFQASHLTPPGLSFHIGKK